MGVGTSVHYLLSYNIYFYDCNTSLYVIGEYIVIVFVLVAFEFILKEIRISTILLDLGLQ